MLYAIAMGQIKMFDRTSYYGKDEATDIDWLRQVLQPAHDGVRQKGSRDPFKFSVSRNISEAVDGHSYNEMMIGNVAYRMAPISMILRDLEGCFRCLKTL